jgi:FAD binding domain
MGGQDHWSCMDRCPPQPPRATISAARRAARQALRFALLPPLPTIPDVEFLTPNSPKYDQYLAASNLRTTLRPALRALCKTGQSVGAVLDWVRTNGLPFAVRSGGHSYEGFSQSVNVVIDTRLIDSVTLDPGSETVTVGAGASLGNVTSPPSETAPDLADFHQRQGHAPRFAGKGREIEPGLRRQIISTRRSEYHPSPERVHGHVSSSASRASLPKGSFMPRRWGGRTEQHDQRGTSSSVLDIIKLNKLRP